MNPRSFPCLVLVVSVCCALVPHAVAGGPSGADADAAPSTPVGDVVREWLVCGPFPNPPRAGQAADDDAPPRVGLDIDYLQDHGGETAIVPRAGMTHPIADGATAAWCPHATGNGTVDLAALLTTESNVVAYAAANLVAERDGECLLALGSDDGVCVWLNGERVHHHLVGRAITADEDLVGARLREGINRLLVKVEQGHGGWGFTLRSLAPGHVLSTVEGDPERLSIAVAVRSAIGDAGKEVSVVDNGRVLGAAEMTPDTNGVAGCTVELPFPEYGRDYAEPRIVIADDDRGSVDLSDCARDRADMLRWAMPRGYPCVFTGEELPRIDFDRPLWARHVFGPYTISATYYDRDYNEVTAAAEPGRYGAVATIETADTITRRFVTLFRIPESIRWWDHDLGGGIVLPEGMGIPPDTVSDYQQWVNRFTGSQLATGFERRPGGAALLAGLYEASRDGSDPGYYNQPDLRDRRWWLPLKRRLYGLDERYTEPFVCPVRVTSEPARVVREGTLREAGMKPGFPSDLHEHLSAWAADSDEAFAVIVVRHGVIAFHEAYGMRGDEPMTVTTPSWMASTTKMMSGTLMMMLVDQGLLSLDDRADAFLPPLREAAEEFPATIRHLYTHTAGMEGHWGSWFSDMEERVSDMIPFYEVGERYLYDGAGLDLCGKILEGITNETLPDFFQAHLFRPLGCEHTQVDNACGSAGSIPFDMARIGQMLLQKGAYGDMRFFTEETFEQMLPERLTKVLGPDTDVEYGIGTSWFKDDGLGEGTFAHGAASSAFTRIDPVNDLVIVMTRNRAGTNFDKYRARFFEIIVDNLLPAGAPSAADGR